jgi:hypothetical protein
LEVVWGSGQLEDAVKYLVDLCVDGRLKAQTTEMKRLISRTRRVETEAFNDLVADAFAEYGAVVRKRVKTIAGHRIDAADPDPKERSAAVRHVRRVDWLRLHVDETLTWLKLESSDGPTWNVDGCIVVNAAPLSPYLRRSPVQVVPWIRLREEMPRLLNRRRQG